MIIQKNQIKNILMFCFFFSFFFLILVSCQSVRVKLVVQIRLYSIGTANDRDTRHWGFPPFKKTMLPPCREDLFFSIYLYDKTRIADCFVIASLTTSLTLQKQYTDLALHTLYCTADTLPKKRAQTCPPTHIEIDLEHAIIARNLNLPP